VHVDQSPSTSDVRFRQPVVAVESGTLHIRPKHPTSLGSRDGCAISSLPKVLVRGLMLPYRRVGNEVPKLVLLSEFG
jgi:hypothetical protein